VESFIVVAGAHRLMYELIFVCIYTYRYN